MNPDPLLCPLSRPSPTIDFRISLNIHKKVSVRTSRGCCTCSRSRAVATSVPTGERSLPIVQVSRGHIEGTIDLFLATPICVCYTRHANTTHRRQPTTSLIRSTTNAARGEHRQSNPALPAKRNSLSSDKRIAARARPGPGPLPGWASSLATRTRVQATQNPTTSSAESHSP